MQDRVEIAGDHLETLGNCGGYYSCPKAPDGTRLGPLVGYACKYSNGSCMQQWVGDIYANFAKAEVHPRVLKFFAAKLAELMTEDIGIDNIDFLCAAPIGGYALATAMSVGYGIPAIKAEKKVVELAVGSSREKSKLVFGRHSIEPGCRYVIVEDVCNNFSTTEELISLITSAGGIVVAIVCFLNRSLTVEGIYHSTSTSLDIPVIGLVRMPINEWKQDDPAVASDISKFNVVLDPKKNWGLLEKAMADHK